MHGVRVLVQDAHGRVLLIRHSYGSDKWMPPGGGMHRGEDLHGSSNAVRIVLGRTGDSPRADGREIVEAGFFTLDALPAHMSPGLAQRIREWAAQA
ncbi:NUDIX domain-containing protein [Novosphingobium sp. BL-52-GroH]|uniref:NUDIX domain-containing protein n=1 Tax=Novosphingobium sp. BL-52-GroH TaxID=3349877 RepID=UPI00384CE809